MSLFVDVAITADSIVKAAWARAVANRERLRRRLDVQAVREDASRRGVKDDFWETVYTTPTPSLYKPDEPVAYPINDKGVSVIGRVFTYVSTPLTYDNSPEMRVWSGDGQQSAVLPIEWHARDEVVPWLSVAPELISVTPTIYRFTANSVYRDGPALKYSFASGDYAAGVDNFPTYNVIDIFNGYDGTARTHILPLGGGNSVVIFSWNYRLSAYLAVNIDGLGTPTIIHDVKSEYRGQAAYLVTQTTIRSLTVPSSIADRPSWVNGQPAADYYSPGPADFGDARPWLDDEGTPLEALRTPSQFLWFGDANRELLATTGNNPGPASIRALLPENVRTFRSLAVYDNSADYDYEPSNEPFTITTSGTAREWRADDPSPIAEAFPPSNANWRQVKIKPVPPVVLPANPQPATVGTFFVEPYNVWDWGKPAYCRQQLLALGFSPADLTP